MKNKIILVIYLIFQVCVSQAQNSIDPSGLGILTDPSNSSLVNKNPNVFLKSWNWYQAGKNFDEALGMNAGHDLSITSSNIANGMLGIQPLRRANGEISQSRGINSTFNGESLCLIPALDIPTNNSFTPISGTNNGAVFGFKTKETSSYGSITGDKYKLSQNSAGYNSNGISVLSNAWDGSILKWLNYPLINTIVDAPIGCNNCGNYKYYDETSNAFQNLNGKQFYLSINITSLSDAQLSALADNAKVLTLRLNATTRIVATKQSSTVSIRFSSIPDDSQNLTNIFNNRATPQVVGQTLIEKTLSPINNDFVITGKMLKKLISATNRSITLSALIDFSGKVNGLGQYLNNPAFKQDFWENFNQQTLGNNNKVLPFQYPEYIENISPEILYHNNLDLEINWVRLETPSAREVFRGAHDNEVVEMLNQIITNTSAAAGTTAPKINKIYLADEMVAHQWGIARYVNALCDNFGTTETMTKSWDFDVDLERMLYATNIKGLISGSGIGFGGTAPYLMKGNFNNDWRTIGRNGGYAGLYNHPFTQNSWLGQLFSSTQMNEPKEGLDSLNSEYETFNLNGNGVKSYLNSNIVDIDNTFKPYTYDVSEEYKWLKSPLFDAEYSIYIGYYNGWNMLYGQEPWVQNLWVQSERWRYDKPDVNEPEQIIGPGGRPMTGEEISLMAGLPLCLGTKGFNYWIKCRLQNQGLDYVPNKGVEITSADLSSMSFFNNSVEIGLINSNTPSETGYSLLYSDNVDNDWLHFGSNSSYNWNGTRTWVDNTTPTPVTRSKTFFDDRTKFDWKEMGLDRKQNGLALDPTNINDKNEYRTYIGLKSARTQLRKIHNFVEANETTLLNLELQAWYGKGFFKMQNSKTKNDNYIKQFVDVDNIKTKKIAQPQLSGGYQTTNLPDEASEQSFFDITILKDKREFAGTNQVFYIGVQNRRTDPLIWTNELDNNTNWHLSFQPTAVFDEQLKNSNLTVRNQWIARLKQKLGCRNITIPFNINSGNTINYKLLHVKELTNPHSELSEAWGSGTTTLNAAQIESIYPAYDNVIAQNKSISVDFLPGEFKIFKVEILEPALITNANLDNSNQTKLVTFPCYDPITNQPNGKVQYHVVYTKLAYNLFTGYENQVFYNKSEPTSKNEDKANVKWIYGSLGMQISDINIMQNQSGNLFTTNKPEKAEFPSLIVRRVGNNTIAYIMFQSNYKSGGIWNPNGYIHEGIYNVNDIGCVRLQNYVVSSFYMDTELPENIGNPVINAAKDGNFCAWTTKVVTGNESQIKYLYRSANTNKIMSPINSITNTQTGSQSNAMKRHPSLNAYSELTNTAILTWNQFEPIDPEDPTCVNKVYYTYLKQNGVGSTNFLHTQIDTRFTSKISLKNSNKIVKLIYSKDADFPTVSLVESTQPYYTKQKIVFSWRSKGKWKFGFSTLKYDQINSMSAVSALNNLDLTDKYRIVNTDVVSAPFAPFDKTPLTSPNCIMGDQSNSTTNDYIINYLVGSQLMHTNKTSIGYWDYFKGFYSVSSSNSYFICNNARINHISQLPTSLLNPNEIWYNRRIIEENSTKNLYTNANRYYKKIVDSDIDVDNLMNLSNGSKDYAITNPIIDGNEYPIVLQVDSLNTPFVHFAFHPTDTLHTNWFQISNNSNMNLKIFGTFYDTTKVDTVLYIQKQSDMSLVPLPVYTNTTDSTGILLKMQLVNGGDSLYRFVVLRRDSTYLMEENTLLGGLPVPDTLNYKKSETSVKIIDLASKTSHSFDNESILVYPNPTNGIVNISPAFMEDNKLQNTNVIIIISNITGATIYTTKSRNGSQISFDTSKLTTGSYIVTCETEHDEFKQTRTLTSKFTVTK